MISAPNLLRLLSGSKLWFPFIIGFLLIGCAGSKSSINDRPTVVNPNIDRVYYPGLKNHPDYELAKKQMKGFGAMLSFELKEGIDPMEFQRSLALIKPSMSLAGLESTTVSPAQTTHALLSEEERLERGIRNGLIRFSTGIEENEDIIYDIDQAISRCK